MNIRLTGETQKRYAIEQIQQAPINNVKPLVMTLRKEEQTRTAEQNRWYWAVVTLVVAETGNSKDYVHEYFKETFLEEKAISGSFGSLTKKPTTTGLSPKKFSALMENINMWCIEEFGWPIPFPDDPKYGEFMEKYA